MVALALWARLLWLQVIQPDHWVSIARRQHLQVLELPPTRGSILDRNRKPLAVCLRLTSVFADPRHLKRPELAAQRLAPVLNRPESALLARLSRKDRGFVWLARRIPNSAARQVRAMNLPGVHLVMESQRFYPHGYLASHVIGFAGLDTQGLEGLELAFDRVLKGEPGWRWLARDARRRNVGAWGSSAVLPRDGLEVVLTLDTTLQYVAEKALDEAWRKSKARGACIIVSDPMTGEVLALANRPSYDPNRFGQTGPEERRNRAVTDTFEPGSVFKIVTAAVALGTRKVRPEDKFDCENGQYPVAGRILHDHQPHGILTFREVIAQSSNIGVAKAAMQVGAQPIYHGIRAFGVGDRSGLELPGEAAGTVKHPREWSRPTITAVPMGHEVAVTALQLSQIISVVANGGWLIRPWVVKEVREPATGAVVKRFEPRPVRRVVTKETAALLQDFLTAAVDHGTGKLAQLSGFRAAGKTGTAQKLEPNGQYSHSKFMASFVGFAPAERPRLAIVVVIDEPRYPYYGGVVAAPVFRKVATDGLAYLGCRPAIVSARREE